MRTVIFALAVAATAVVACDQGKSKLDNISSSAPLGSAGSDGAIDINSTDILSRPAGGDEVIVKHVLIAWGDLDKKTYHGRIDPRAAKRTNAEAAQLARSIADKLRESPDQIDALIKEHSEDPGSLTGEPYTITKDTPFVPEFKALAMRLNLKEVGIVKTQFGYHVIERVAPPPPDPLESAEILARPANPGTVQVQHVLVGWKDAPGAKRGADPRAMARTKPDADKLAQDILTKARAGDDFAKLMKEFSEDPGSKDDAKPYDVSADAPLVEPFKKLALRLKENEVGLVKSLFGWHIMKRIPPPPPDTLESAEILKREVLTQKAKVKHVLLSWQDMKPTDPRAQKRTRADLEKLVKDTVAKLQGGAKIEDVMKELSEDPGSAKSGESYDVTPTAQLVEPFKNLSLRLNVNEIGVVKTQFGIHIIKRVE